jgi:hypothetical protein
VRRTGVATIAAATALALAGPLAPSPASAASAPTIGGTAALAGCVQALASMERTAEADAGTAALATARQGREIPGGPPGTDTSSVTKSDLAAAEPALERPRAMRAQAERRLPDRVVIPVHAHIIKGSHRGEQNVRRPAIKRWIGILNRAYAGQQGALSPNTRYRFQLRTVDFTKRDAWYHAFRLGARDAAAKRALARGPASHLNLYVNRPTPSGFPILGWARFPWQRASQPKLDHVSVSTDAMPGGRARGYNLGDTLVHEVGHWMGLFHTFQGGCGDKDLPDGLNDTPAESEPSYDCEVGRDTCSAAGVDPVRNFMNYSRDNCMNQFTVGQVTQMDNMFMQYRLGKP